MQKHLKGGGVKNFEVGGQILGLGLVDLYEAYIPNIGFLLSLKPFETFSFVGAWVNSEFSVLLWAKAFGFGLGPS